MDHGGLTADLGRLTLLAAGAFRKQADFTTAAILVPRQSSIDVRLEQMDQVM